MRILVCDDIAKRGNETCSFIREAGTEHEVVPVFDGALKAEIEKIFQHAQCTLDRTYTSPETDDGDSIFNEPCSDVLMILDNNLAELKISGARHTAESIVGYLRAFTNVPYVVSLNKNPQVDFDLRYLVGDYRTDADLALNTKHLAYPALWTGETTAAADRFFPWYWPVLNRTPAVRRRQIDFVEKHYDEPIVTALAFPTQYLNFLSRHARGALSPKAVGTENVTIGNFFLESCRSLPVFMDREELSDRIDRGDDSARRIAARVAAAELERWIRRDVLGPQGFLVDLPHLLMRLPFLLGEHVNDLDRWNDVVLAAEPPFGLDEELYENHLKDVKFEGEIWTKSPCFWWPKLKEDEELNRMFFRDGSNWADAVFCEDLSRFVLRSKGPQETLREFATEFEGSWQRRHVEVVDKMTYSPKSRFAV